MTWSLPWLVVLGAVLRVLLVWYARIHDHMFDVAYTDIDYSVFTDAAKHMLDGASPYDRATYRYSPIFAAICIPNHLLTIDFGKYVFAIGDLVSALAVYCIVHKFVSKGNKRDAVLAASMILFNPVCAVVSTRGNGDSIVCAAVLTSLYLVLNGNWLASAIMHGLFAVQLKLYPIIYLPSVYLYLAGQRNNALTLRSILWNPRGVCYCVVSMACFTACVYGWFRLYGDHMINEYILYHVGRVDVRHNFSFYFYPMYLACTAPALHPRLCRALQSFSFVPQLLVIVFAAFKYSDMLPMAWLVSTWAFVCLNKVWTSQYIVWYGCLLPLVVCRLTRLTTRRAMWALSLWIGAQLVWLFWAYLLEFRGMNVIYVVWLSSVLVFFSNFYAIVVVTESYTHANQSHKRKAA